MLQHPDETKCLLNEGPFDNKNLICLNTLYGDQRITPFAM